MRLFCSRMCWWVSILLSVLVFLPNAQAEDFEVKVERRDISTQSPAVGELGTVRFQRIGGPNIVEKCGPFLSNYPDPGWFVYIQWKSPNITAEGNASQYSPAEMTFGLISKSNILTAVNLLKTIKVPVEHNGPLNNWTDVWCLQFHREAASKLYRNKLISLPPGQRAGMIVATVSSGLIFLALIWAGIDAHLDHEFREKHPEFYPKYFAKKDSLDATEDTKKEEHNGKKDAGSGPKIAAHHGKHNGHHQDTTGVIKNPLHNGHHQDKTGVIKNPLHKQTHQNTVVATPKGGPSLSNSGSITAKHSESVAEKNKKIKPGAFSWAKPPPVVPPDAPGGTSQASAPQRPDSAATAPLPYNGKAASANSLARAKEHWGSMWQGPPPPGLAHSEDWSSKNPKKLGSANNPDEILGKYRLTPEQTKEAVQDGKKVVSGAFEGLLDSKSRL